MPGAARGDKTPTEAVGDYQAVMLTRGFGAVENSRRMAAQMFAD